MLIVPHGYGFFTPEARADCALGSGFFARGGDFSCSVIVEDIGLWHGGILRFVVGGEWRTDAHKRIIHACERGNNNNVPDYPRSPRTRRLYEYNQILINHGPGFPKHLP